LLMANLVVISSQSVVTTNVILMLFSILPENHKSNWETKWIFGFYLIIGIIYSLPRIYHDDWKVVWWVGRLVVGNW
jgi:hypothetical protein